MKKNISILHVVGARPQFMKLYPLYIEMKEKGINQKILHIVDPYTNFAYLIFMGY